VAPPRRAAAVHWPRRSACRLRQQFRNVEIRMSLNTQCRAHRRAHLLSLDHGGRFRETRTDALRRSDQGALAPEFGETGGELLAAERPMKSDGRMLCPAVAAKSAAPCRRPHGRKRFIDRLKLARSIRSTAASCGFCACRLLTSALSCRKPRRLTSPVSDRPARRSCGTARPAPSPSQA